jgi:hypothetical protein
MNQSWKNELFRLLETVVGAPYGTTPFWITAGIALGAILILGWLIASFVLSAKRGFIVSFLAHIVPAAAAAAGWIAVTIYAVPELGAGAVRDYMPLAGAILAAFLATMLLSRFLLGISEGATLLSVLLTYACAAGAIFLGGSMVGQVDSSLDSLDEKNKQRQKETESILTY